MNTVIGIVADELGLAHDPAQRRSRWATPASELRPTQPARIPVDIEHDGDWCGQVLHLERDDHGRVWALAHVDATPSVRVLVGDETIDVPHDLYFSIERTPFDTDILIRSVALTRRPARLGAHPVTWYPGSLADRSGWHTDWRHRPLIARASETRYTRHGGPLVIHDTEPPAKLRTVPFAASAPAFEERGAGRLLLRSAETLDVSESGRTIELIVTPYDTPARVPYEGRMVSESFAPTAFDGIERQGNRIRANRDHDERRTVGVATRLDPRDRRGLLAEIQIARTPLGDESLALAAADCLDASAAFRPLDMQWRGRSAYTVTRAWLGHIALTPDPAYVDARVLAVH